MLEQAKILYFEQLTFFRSQACISNTLLNINDQNGLLMFEMQEQTFKPVYLNGIAYSMIKLSQKAGDLDIGRSNIL